jgi:hypothetical protein
MLFFEMILFLFLKKNRLVYSTCDLVLVSDQSWIKFNKNDLKD